MFGCVCVWCHVMTHRSAAQPETLSDVNPHLVSALEANN